MTINIQEAIYTIVSVTQLEKKHRQEISLEPAFELSTVVGELYAVTPLSTVSVSVRCYLDNNFTVGWE